MTSKKTRAADGTNKFTLATLVYHVRDGWSRIIRIALDSKSGIRSVASLKRYRDRTQTELNPRFHRVRKCMSISGKMGGDATKLSPPTCGVANAPALMKCLATEAISHGHGRSIPTSMIHTQARGHGRNQVRVSFTRPFETVSASAQTTSALGAANANLNLKYNTRRCSLKSFDEPKSNVPPHKTEISREL